MTVPKKRRHEYVEETNDGRWVAVWPTWAGGTQRATVNTEWAARLLVMANNGGRDPEVRGGRAMPFLVAERRERRQAYLDERADGAAALAGVGEQGRLTGLDGLRLDT